MVENKPKQAKSPLLGNLLKGIDKVFAILRDIFSAISHFLDKLLHFWMHLIALSLKNATNPITAILFVSGIFAVVMAITLSQWYSYGAFLARYLPLDYAGIGLGTASILLGAGINIFQLMPELYKIRRDIAKAYTKLGVNPDYESPQEEKSVSSRLTNWLSSDHAEIRKMRNFSYFLEVGIVVFFTVVTGLTYKGIMLAFIALTLPENTLKFLASTISLMGGISNEVAEEETI